MEEVCSSRALAAVASRSAGSHQQSPWWTEHWAVWLQGGAGEGSSAMGQRAAEIVSTASSSAVLAAVTWQPVVRC